MKDFDVDLSYIYSKIDKAIDKAISNDPNTEIYWYGPAVVGQHFLCVLTLNRTTSFILEGGTGTNYIYKCVYNQ